MNNRAVFGHFRTGFRHPVTSSLRSLQERFKRIWAAPATAESVWLELESRYAESHRRFHTLRHVAECLSIADQYAAMVGWPSLPRDLELALWFHDIVYEPGCRQNEACSAEVFEEFAALAGINANVILGASSLILETATHEGSGVLLSGVM